MNSYWIASLISKIQIFCTTRQVITTIVRAVQGLKKPKEEEEEGGERVIDE